MSRLYVKETRDISLEMPTTFIQKQGYDKTLALEEEVKAYVKTWDTIHPDTQNWLDRKTEG